MKKLNQRILLEKTLLHSIKNGVLLYDEKEKAKQLHRIISKSNKNQRKGLVKMTIKIEGTEIKRSGHSTLYIYTLEDGSTILATEREHELLFYNTADGILDLSIILDGHGPHLEEIKVTPIFSEAEYNDDPVECIGFIKS